MAKVTDTFRICNNSCSSMPRIVTRTCLNVTFLHTLSVLLFVRLHWFCSRKIIGCTQAQNFIPGICDSEQYFVHNSWSIYIPNFKFPGHKQTKSNMANALVRYLYCTSREWQEKFRKCRERWRQNGNCTALRMPSNRNRPQSAVMWRSIIVHLKSSIKQ
jgi:hypothetical protein